MCLKRCISRGANSPYTDPGLVPSWMVCCCYCCCCRCSHYCDCYHCCHCHCCCCCCCCFEQNNRLILKFMQKNSFAKNCQERFFWEEKEPRHTRYNGHGNREHETEAFQAGSNGHHTKEEACSPLPSPALYGISPRSKPRSCHMQGWRQEGRDGFLQNPEQDRVHAHTGRPDLHLRVFHLSCSRGTAKDPPLLC